MLEVDGVASVQSLKSLPRHYMRGVHHLGVCKGGIALSEAYLTCLEVVNLYCVIDVGASVPCLDCEQE